MSESVNEEMGSTHPLTNSSTHLLKTPIIQVKHLSKRYQIGMDRTYKTFCETAVNTLKSPLKRLKSFSRQEETFWALKDVNFEVYPGEVVGIIGRNGAGKTTLLKILSRITHPTEGEVILRGRVGSLLEVGTGFHPELTGRENIYFNGAILGMTKQEIEAKFDEIVAFSGVKDFLDTPLKRYSSGMQVRLAFAVAAHLEPEILLVDEVLAVGDAEFQKKCLGKMGEVAEGGRTVLFVSHNMGAVQRLCPRAIYLSKGRIVTDGPSQKVINLYIHGSDNQYENEQLPSMREYEVSSAPGDEFVKLKRVSIISSDGSAKSSFRMDEEFLIEIECTILKSISNFHLYIHVHNQDGILVFNSADWDGGEVKSNHLNPGQYLRHCKIPSNLLNKGRYTLDVNGLIPSVRFLFQESSALTWTITSQGGIGGVESVERQGICRILLQWS
jgi:lipopolysaccharide transport system ATP-binding protein